MYQPLSFKESRPEFVERLLADFPLAMLAVASAQGLVVHHLPLLRQGESLLGHVARGNELLGMAGLPVVAVFQGPQAYVTPGWHPDKSLHGRVVPTWNYAVVHVHGQLQIHDDAAWVLDVLRRQSDRQEARQAQPWSLDEAPPDFISALATAVVGIEIRIEHVEAKFKLSQNKPIQTRMDIVAGLQHRTDPADGVLAEWITAAALPPGTGCPA